MRALTAREIQYVQGFLLLGLSRSCFAAYDYLGRASGQRFLIERTKGEEDEVSGELSDEHLTKIKFKMRQNRRRMMRRRRPLGRILMDI